MKILIFQRILPDYRVSFFNELVLKSKHDYLICFSQEKANASLKTTTNNIHFNHSILPKLSYFNKETAISQHVIKILRQTQPNYVITEFALLYLTMWKLIIFRPLFRYKLLFWSHGIQNEEIFSPFTGLKGKIRLFLMKKADAHITYSTKRGEDLKKFLPKSIPIISTPNTNLNLEKLEHAEMLYRSDRNMLREKVFGKHNKNLNLIYCGRLIPEKRIDLLVETFLLLSTQMHCCLHIIGDGPENFRLKELKNQFSNLYLYGETWDNKKIGDLIFSADVFLNPGRVGLSIVDSFNYGCPFITCTPTNFGPFHSPEFEYLIHDYNGFAVDYNAKALSNTVLSLSNSPEKVNIMRTNARNTALKKCKIDNMVKGFDSIIELIQ